MNEQTNLIAIPLNGLKHMHALHDGSEGANHLFVGRNLITAKLIAILRSDRGSGSYLITGYRGSGKTSILKEVLYRCQNEKRKLLVINISLEGNRQLTLLNIYYSIAKILREKILQESYIARHFEFKQILKGIDDLIERMSFEITVGLSTGMKFSGLHYDLSEQKKRLPISDWEVGEQLSRILRYMQNASRKIVLVIDEIDKFSGNKELSEVQYKDNSNSQELSKINRINALLESFKNFVTMSDAIFFFILGQETLYRSNSEKSSSDSLYESLFEQVFEVPSFLTDQGELTRGNRLSALIEEFVCRRIREKKEQSFDGANDKAKYDYYSLTAYRNVVKERPILNDGRELTDEQLQQGINTLRNFIHYLTFHSLGNPKRLFSIFENFIVLKDDVKRVIANRSVLLISEKDAVADYWLVFNSIHQRSFSFASELMTLFANQPGREVAKISDKLAISTLSSLHYILKLHRCGFTRESLVRIAEALNGYRSIELNSIVDDLLTHVFKPYIRRIRNGVYRYRFDSGFEQELRYLSDVSKLESTSYNFSLDSMRYGKKFFQDVLANNDGKEVEVISRARIALGDMCVIEQSYTAAADHYSIATRDLASVLGKSDSPINQESLLRYIEAMIKQGDLEERNQNYDHAAAIYSDANRIVENLHDYELRCSLLKGDSKLDLLKQPFWALHFLSLKRSPRPFKSNSPATGTLKLLPHTYEFEHPPVDCNPLLPSYLYRGNDQRFYYRAGNLSFFLGEAECAFHFYLKVLDILRKNYGKSGFPDERVAYLAGKARVGLAESALVYQSRKLYKIYTTPSKKGERQFATKLLEDMAGYSYIYRRIGKPLKIAAIGFERNKLYISAATAHIKAISYYTAILDVFDSNIFHNDAQNSKELTGLLADITNKVFKEVLERGADAIRCINRARQLETSQNNETFVMHDLENSGAKHEMTITQLFDMLTGSGISKIYPVAEPIFWQNSLWAHKLAATLCWAYYVKHKIEIKPNNFNCTEIEDELPENLPSILGMSGFSVRPAILLRWIWARNLNRRYINRKLMIIGDKKCNTDEALDRLSEQSNDVKLTKDCGKDVVDYIFLLSEENDTQKDVPEILRKAYLISRYLYLAQESSLIISRKNLDLIFPSLPQIYFTQWKLLLNLILATLVGSRENANDSSKKLRSIRDFSLLIQRVFTIIDQKLAPDERIAASHFDYEFIYLRLSESLESSINMVDRTSRTHMGIFQHKYYCHDDHSDPDFQTDYTLAYMFSPRARYLHKEVVNTHNELKLILENHP